MPYFASLLFAPLFAASVFCYQIIETTVLSFGRETRSVPYPVQGVCGEKFLHFCCFRHGSSSDSLFLSVVLRGAGVVVVPLLHDVSRVWTDG